MCPGRADWLRKSALVFNKADIILGAEFVDLARGHLLGFMNVRKGTPARAHIYSHGLENPWLRTSIENTGKTATLQITGMKGKDVTQALLHSVCCQR
jgi:hypothetical protein